MPVSSEALHSSEAFRTLDGELRSAPFADKIAWSILAQRASRLHATLCGALSVDVETPPVFTREQREKLASLGGVRVQIRGLFSGNINTGRLYLRVYPEKRDGVNAFHAIQTSLGRSKTDLYLIGMYNLKDHLTAKEAGSLYELLQRWWDKLILEIEVSTLWLLWSTDDLVLNADIAECIALQAPLA